MQLKNKNPVQRKREKVSELGRRDTYAIVPQITLDTHTHTQIQSCVSVLQVKIDEPECAVYKHAINSVGKLYILKFLSVI